MILDFLKCPKCGNEDIFSDEIDKYWDKNGYLFEVFECECRKCKIDFRITRLYEVSPKKDIIKIY